MYSLEGPRRPKSLFRKTIDQLPGRRQRAKELEVKDELVTAFVAKAYKDIQRDGFTVLRHFSGDKGYVSQIANCAVTYKNGDETYNVSLTAVKKHARGTDPVCELSLLKS